MKIYRYEIYCNSCPTKSPKKPQRIASYELLRHDSSSETHVSAPASAVGASQRLVAPASYMLATGEHVDRCGAELHDVLQCRRGSSV